MLVGVSIVVLLVAVTFAVLTGAPGAALLCLPFIWLIKKIDDES